MSKQYRCVAASYKHGSFTVGKVYELDSDGCVACDSGDKFLPCGFPTAIDWIENHIGYKFEEVKEMFTLNDLKNGMLVELRDGDRCLVLRNNECDSAAEHVLVSVKQKSAYDLDSYTTNCKHQCCKDYDIMRVVRPFSYPYLTDVDYEFTRTDHVIFDRVEVEERKRMTVEEIEAKLGYKIAVVDKEGANRG